MNINDPFGRLAQKREVEYASYSKTLAQASIDTPDAARLQLTATRKRAKFMAAMIVGPAIAVIVLRPDITVHVLAIAGVVLLWLAVTMKKALRYTKRYLAELEAGRQHDA